MTERRPPSDWTPIRGEQIGTGDPKFIAVSTWTSGPILVVSALEVAELPDQSGEGPQWHISISRVGGKRAKPHHIRRALRAFRMVGAEEDNHHPGVARHFWIPVDPRHRVGCECKESEEVVTDPDGYEWTNPHPTEGACRGCEYQNQWGKPCPIHAAENHKPEVHT